MCVRERARAHARASAWVFFGCVFMGVSVMLKLLIKYIQKQALEQSHA